MSELRVRVGDDVGFQLIPVPVVIADLLARRTDGQQAAQGLDVLQGDLQFPDEAFSFLLRTLVQEHQYRRNPDRDQAQHPVRHGEPVGRPVEGIEEARNREGCGADGHDQGEAAGGRPQRDEDERCVQGADCHTQRIEEIEDEDAGSQQDGRPDVREAGRFRRSHCCSLHRDRVQLLGTCRPEAVQPSLKAPRV